MSRYAGGIVDAHHHFWEPSLGRNPWLLPDAAIPFRYGGYESIKKDYFPDDLLADAAGFRIVGTVTMETEWDLDDPVGEMRHMASIADRFGLPSGAVAHAQLKRGDVEGTLEQLASIPLVRGVRNKPGQAASAATAPATPTLLTDPDWQRGYALLARYGLDFELQTAWWHLDDALTLAQRHPDIPMIVNHTALPVDRSREGIDGWAQALTSIASAPNVSIKISGIGLQGVPWTAENNREIVERTAEIFGPDRIMFASNFPVDGLTGSYADIMGGFVTIAEGWSDDEQRQAFLTNAIRIYRLDPALASA
ncbi:amidohydrolase family protein [Mycetocola sp. 2940]|uniref:amidohydrolase family protein n=1 Tax=Mycetocola sp. 2940 TaxID=3156452 RepID=UPI003390AC2D